MNTLPIDVLMTWPGWQTRVNYYRNQGHTLTGAKTRAASYFRMYYNADGTPTNPDTCLLYTSPSPRDA